MKPKEIVKYLQFADDDLDLVILDKKIYHQLLEEHLQIKEIQQLLKARSKKP